MLWPIPDEFLRALLDGDREAVDEAQVPNPAIVAAFDGRLLEALAEEAPDGLRAYVAAQLSALDEARHLVAATGGAPLAEAELALAEGDVDRALHILRGLPAEGEAASSFRSLLEWMARFRAGVPNPGECVPGWGRGVPRFARACAALRSNPDAPAPDFDDCPWPLLRAQLLGATLRGEGVRDGEAGDAVAREHLRTLESIALSLDPGRRALFWQQPQRAPERRRSRTAPETRSTDSERLVRLTSILGRLATERDTDRLLERITMGAVELTGAERGAVLLPEGEGGALTPFGPRSSSVGALDEGFSRSIAEAVLLDGQPIVTVDARNDPRVSEYLSVHRLALTSVACIPIRAPSRTLGVLYLEHRMRRGRFVDEDLDLLLAFADQAAIALESARAFRELEARSAALAEANEALRIAQAELQQRLDARTHALEDAERALDRREDPLGTGYERYGIIGRSEPMRRVLAVVDRARDVDVPVVIRGESGTGKELVARALHDAGARREGPFVALCCGAIPEALIESELFGHARGAFTGAHRARQGAFARAEGGTLFLDEIADMPAKMQVDLLRVLQDKRFRAVGDDVERTADVRVVAASNRSLRSCVDAGTFREDLFYRLNVVEIAVPPLRERPEDIPALALHFLRKTAERREERPKTLTASGLRALVAHPLPGNVRQLEHLLAGAEIITAGDVIDAEAFAPPGGGDAHASNLAPAIAARVAAAIAHATGDVDAVLPEPLPGNVAQHKVAERHRILSALEEVGWNRAAAARKLGMPRRTFYRRLKEHGILQP